MLQRTVKVEVSPHPIN